MSYPESSVLIWLLGFIQIAGLASAWLARLSEGSANQTSCHRIFFACLALIGLSTMVALAMGPKYWLASGITLSVMVLAAIWDFRPATSPESL